MKEVYELSDKEKKIVIDFWNSKANEQPPTLQEILNEVFNDEQIDGRSQKGIAVRKYLSSLNIKASTAHDYKPKLYILSSSEKEFVKNNIETMTALEVARVLLKDAKLSHRDYRASAIINYAKEINVENRYQDANEEVAGSYKPPRTIDRMVYRVNRYIFEKIDKDNLSAKQKKNIESLICYVNTYRFIHQINTYENNTDKELFESSFVRYTNDKNDLTQEEVDQYIVLSQEVVISANIQRRVERLQRLLDEAADNPEGARISMSLVESINTAQTEYNQCVSRQQKLLNDLKEKRSDKLKKQIQENASILNLVQLWKNEDERLKLLKLAEMQKAALKNEVDRLTTMEDIKCKIMGLTNEEAING
jgi:hypothetical protein